jgi:hypothetical protein
MSNPYDDPAVVRAMEVLTGHGITGAQYERLISRAVEERVPVSRCPECNCVEGAHLEVLGFNHSTGQIDCRYTACTCGCRRYLT